MTKQQNNIFSKLHGEYGKYFFIFPVAFLMATATSLLALGMIFYLKEIFNASAEQVGFYSGLWPASYLTGCFIFRPLYKRISSQILVLIASFCMMSATIGILYAHHIQVTYTLQLTYGLSIAFLWPPLMGWMSAGNDGKKLGNIMSYYNLSWSTGVIAGPFIAGYLSEINVKWSIHVGAIMFFLVILIMITSKLFVTSNEEIESAKKQTTSIRLDDNSTPLRYPSWICVLVGYALLSGLMTIVPIYFKDIIQLQERTIGALLLVRALVFSIAFIIWAKTSFWHFSPKIIILNQTLLVIFCGIMYLCTHSLAGIVTVMALMSICITVCYSISQFHGVAGSPNRTLRMTIHESLLSIGMGLGAYLSGIIYDTYSFKMVFAFFGALTLIGLTIQLIIIIKMQLNLKNVEK